VTAVDYAILVAFCRAYISGQRFPCPSSNNKILEELRTQELYLDLDTLRGHLRNLYAKFGVADGLTPAEKRVRLVERVYESNLVEGWGEYATGQTEGAAAAGADVGAGAPPATGAGPTTSVAAPPADAIMPTRDAAAGERGAADPDVGRLRFTAFVRERAWHLGIGITVVTGVAVVALIVAAAGGEDAARPSAGSAATPLSPSLIDDAQGSVTYCTGKDVVQSADGRRRQHQQAIASFNAEFGPAVHANLHQFPDDATQQYEQFSRLQRKRSGFCDVFYSDVTWTADFAHNGWLVDLTDYVRPRLKTFVAAMGDTVAFDGRLWGVPKQADAALLYYDTAAVKDPPTTWQALYEQAGDPPGGRLRYQGLDYEGLTVNFLEVAYAVGADDIVTPRHEANINQPKALVALQFLVSGIKDHAVPREIVNHTEEESLHAFGRDRADFMRNWPYAYAALQDATQYPNAVGHVGVAPLPSWNDRAPTSVLGGHILVISAFSENPAAALKLVDYLSSADVIRHDATDFALAPPLIELWDDPRVREALPAFGDLKNAIFNARSRPVTPNYQAVSTAISKNVNRALRGQAPEDALEAASDDMQRALDEAYKPTP
jgi:multiple sugar transport system substrate-binding protein